MDNETKLYTINHGRDKIEVRGARLRRDAAPPFPWEWRIIVIAAIGFFIGLVIGIIVYMIYAVYSSISPIS